METGFDVIRSNWQLCEWIEYQTQRLFGWIEIFFVSVRKIYLNQTVIFCLLVVCLVRWVPEHLIPNHASILQSRFIFKFSNSSICPFAKFSIWPHSTKPVSFPTMYGNFILTRILSKNRSLSKQGLLLRKPPTCKNWNIEWIFYVFLLYICLWSSFFLRFFL